MICGVQVPACLPYGPGVRGVQGHASRDQGGEIFTQGAAESGTGQDLLRDHAPGEIVLPKPAKPSHR